MTCFKLLSLLSQKFTCSLSRISLSHFWRVQTCCSISGSYQPLWCFSRQIKGSFPCCIWQKTFIKLKLLWKLICDHQTQSFSVVFCCFSVFVPSTSSMYFVFSVNFWLIIGFCFCEGVSLNHCCWRTSSKLIILSPNNKSLKALSGSDWEAKEKGGFHWPSQQACNPSQVYVRGGSPEQRRG